VYIKSEGDKTRGRSRYIVVEIDGEGCVLQKFVKSQLRGKKYQLKLTEIYPVGPENIEMSGAIRGLEEERCDEDRDYVIVDESPIPSADCVQYEVPAEAIHVESDSAEVSEDVVVETVAPAEEAEAVDGNVDAIGVPVPSPAAEPQRRSKRSTSKPGWMKSGEYDLDG
jgi:hypothetical protein